jgi:hypothetical protein
MAVTMTTKLLGDASLTSATGLANYKHYSKFTATESGTMTEYRIKGIGSGNVKGALYADNAGMPGTLLNIFASTAIASGDNIIAFPSSTIILGTPYWLAFNQQSDYIVGMIASGGTDKYSIADFAVDFTSDPTGLSNLPYTMIIAGWGETGSTPAFIPGAMWF